MLSNKLSITFLISGLAFVGGLAFATPTVPLSNVVFRSLLVHRDAGAVKVSCREVQIDFDSSSPVVGHARLRASREYGIHGLTHKEARHLNRAGSALEVLCPSTGSLPGLVSGDLDHRAVSRFQRKLENSSDSAFDSVSGIRVTGEDLRQVPLSDGSTAREGQNESIDFSHGLDCEDNGFLRQVLGPRVTSMLVENQVRLCRQARMEINTGLRAGSGQVQLLEVRPSGRISVEEFCSRDLVSRAKAFESFFSREEDHLLGDAEITRIVRRTRFCSSAGLWRRTCFKYFHDSHVSNPLGEANSGYMTCKCEESYLRSSERTSSGEVNTGAMFGGVPVAGGCTGHGSPISPVISPANSPE